MNDQVETRPASGTNARSDSPGATRRAQVVTSELRSLKEVARILMHNPVRPKPLYGSTFKLSPRLKITSSDLSLQHASLNQSLRGPGPQCTEYATLALFSSEYPPTSWRRTRLANLDHLPPSPLVIFIFPKSPGRPRTTIEPPVRPNHGSSNTSRTADATCVRSQRLPRVVNACKHRISSTTVRCFLR
jgi:hypothetical protein